MKKRMRFLCCIIVGFILMNGCSVSMSQEQKDDMQAVKAIKEALRNFKEASTMHMVITVVSEDNLNVEGSSTYDVNVSGDDFAGTHTFTDVMTKEIKMDYVYKRGDYQVTYLVDDQNAYNLPPSRIALDLKKDLLNLIEPFEVEKEPVKDYTQRFIVEKNKDGSYSYTDLGSTRTGMKNQPVYTISKDNKFVGYKDFDGNEAKIDGYNTSTLDYEFADCIQMKCRVNN